SSINYTPQEYAADVVYRIKSVCDAASVPHPLILSESGRAMVAYSSVLILDVLGTSKFEANPDMDAIQRAMDAECVPGPDGKAKGEVPQPVLDL
ncbi:hypothetical protein JQC65_26600, partial [Escherichia coli]|nr:hypothetical protein [Escherichia coli]